VSTDLDKAGAAIVCCLGGTWANGGGMCRCPAHADRTPSLSVRRGRSALLFKCFAGCTIAEILQALRAQNLPVPRGSVGLPSGLAVPGWRTDAALRLWRAAQPLNDTPAERYLASRGIPIFSPALRYHPATPLGSGSSLRFLPALIAAVSEGRNIVGVQRNFLQLNGRPAPFSKNKRSLGALREGAVQLSRPAGILGLAEGIENALSASVLLDIPVWATLGAERFAHVAIPSGVSRLVLLADNDGAGRRAAQRAREAYGRAGRELATVWLPQPFNDWNQLLLAGGKGEAGRLRLAA